MKFSSAPHQTVHEVLPHTAFRHSSFYSITSCFSHELHELLEGEAVEAEIINNDWIRYDIQNSVELFFHLKNNKLFRITTLDNYQGKLFKKIGVGTTEKELLEVEPSFVYDDFEEVWESEKGIFIEMDAETNTVRWISVYIRELDDENFENANW